MITIEPFDENDFERLIGWLDQEEVLFQFAGPIFSFPLTVEQLKAYRNETRRLPFKVVTTGDGVAIGHAELFISEDPEMIKICRVLIGDPTKRGQGFGQQTINSLLKRAFLGLGKARAELNVYDWNTNAIKCYEKVGFVVNPELIATLEVNGTTWTAINMTIDKKRWTGYQ